MEAENVKKLLSKKVVDNSSPLNMSGMTALHVACTLKVEDQT